MTASTQYHMTAQEMDLCLDYNQHMNEWIYDILGVRLDKEQRKIIESVQNNRRTSVRSGHARGKDYTAAALALAFLYTNYPSKVILTAPSNRQVLGILMAEISNMYLNAAIPLGGEMLTNRIKFKDKRWYLLGFKASDTTPESWSGFHSDNILVIVSEASGIPQQSFNAIEGILTGTMSRLLLVFNPTVASGEAYNSTKSSLYVKHKLNCLNAPNVLEKKNIIPGQVDYLWVKEKVEKWCINIPAYSGDPTKHEFTFEDKIYRPNDLFLVKVLAEYPVVSDFKLIPLEWIEMANERWKDFIESGKAPTGELRIGADISGMGRDSTIFLHRYLWKEEIKQVNEVQIDDDYESDDIYAGFHDEKPEKPIFKEFDFVEKCEEYNHSDHMDTAEKLMAIHNINGKKLFIDAIGEGAGVHSRVKQLARDIKGCRSFPVKFSESAKGLTDVSRERKFGNMRAYLMWSIRDALDPKLGAYLMLPPDDLLTEELAEPQFEIKSNGEIMIEPKEDIKARIGRSPDRADSLAQTYYPKGDISIRFI